MISIIQRVTTAKVTVNNQDIGKIDTGIMALIAVEKEDTQKPLSDQKIAELLTGLTVNIARRTVTKYREMLNLGSSSERKRHF